MLTPKEVEELFPIRSILVYQNGMTVHRQPIFTNHNKPSPRKGIYEMSKKSKLHLTHIVTNCPIKFQSIMTLTWGDFLPPVNGKELKRQLNVFLKSFRQRYKAHEYLWFLEFQKSGKPHIHIFTTREIVPQDNYWLGQRWPKISVKDAYVRLTEEKVPDYKITKPILIETVLDEWEKSKRVHKHSRAWENFRKKDGAYRYALKYASKSEQKLVPPEYGNVGRFWGKSENVEPKPIGAVLLGQEMSEAEIREMFGHHLVGNLPLIPHYIFQKDAVEYFSQFGLTMSEIVGEKLENFVNKIE